MADLGADFEKDVTVSSRADVVFADFNHLKCC